MRGMKDDYLTSTVDGARGFQECFNPILDTPGIEDECDCLECIHYDDDCIPDCYPCPYFKEIE